MEKICLIHQPAGIGDVFFLQYVARHYMDMGYKVYWPLKENILWIGDYIKDINFCSQNDDFPGKQYYGQDMVILSPNFVYIGLDKAHMWGNTYPVNPDKTCACMEAKYNMLLLDWKQWRHGFKFTRNRKKEEDLYYNVLGLKDDSKYVFCNRYANTENRYNGKVVFPEFDIPTVESEFYDGFCLFDWCMVLERAQEIHTVHTSFNYLIDVLHLSTDKYFMYQGIHNDDVQHIPFLRTNPVYIPNVK